MKKELPLVGLILLLAGCESDFDKCMNTELPRAETLTGIEAEREVGRQLLDLRNHHKALIDAYEKMIQWGQANPRPADYPTGPDNTCGDYENFDSWRTCNSEYKRVREELVNEWKATPDAKLWIERRDAEYSRVGLEIGVSISTEEEFADLFDGLFESYDTLLEPRSTTLQCYGDYECKEYDFMKDEHSEIIEIAFDEAILNNARVIAELMPKAELLATVTCNNNGFYE